MNISRKRKKKAAPPVPEETQFLFDELCEILSKTGVEVRLERGYFNGGLCLLEDRRVFILNRNHAVEQNIELLLEQLSRENLDNIYISPKIREKLDSHHIKIEAQP